MTNIAMIKV